MSAITQHLDEVRRIILKSPKGKELAGMLESKTGVNVEYCVVAVVAILTACLFIGIGAELISNVIGMAYPMFASLQAVESANVSDHTEWLIYWVVFGALCILENFADYILYWIPFYYPLKCVFLLWCMLPRFMGAKVVYENVIKPQFMKHQSAIDAALDSVTTGSVDSKKD